jgi:hypothetical protein
VWDGGCKCVVVGGCGRLWEVVGGCGKLWEVAGGCGMCGVCGYVDVRSRRDKERNSPVGRERRSPGKKNSQKHSQIQSRRNGHERNGHGHGHGHGYRVKRETSQRRPASRASLKRLATSRSALDSEAVGRHCLRTTPVDPRRPTKNCCCPGAGVPGPMR